MSDANVPTDIVGKKVFFVYPSAYVQNQIITELVQQEFEVYISKDHVRLARALKKYSDSIVFINIDEKITEAEWEKWITGIMTALPDIKIGIFTSSTDENLLDKYTKKIQVPCGLINVKLDMSKTISRIFDILNVLNTKGRRKHIRATTERETNATMNMPFNGEFIGASIKDISVVGISCVFDRDPELSKNVLIKDIQIRLQTMLLKVEAIAFGSRIDGGDKIYVMLFTQRVDPEVKVKIRKYVQQNLQVKMDAEIN